jgi:UDP-glucuronate decarboxylase
LDKNLAQAANEIIQKIGPDIQKLSGAKVLVTGAAGFIGAHFTHVLSVLNQEQHLTKPIQITVLDNFSRGEPQWLKALGDQQNFTVIRHNIVEKLAHWPGYNFVVHAASIASPIYYRKFPIQTMDANVIGLRNLLDLGLENQSALQSFLNFSTSEIYGDPDPLNIPTTEEYRGFVSSTGPRACYDESKRYGETLCVNFYQQYKFPVKVARPFNNYGPGLKISDRRVLPDFFRDVLAGRDIEMLSDGSATRTFCYITDAMAGYFKILLSEHNGEAFNIGTEKPEISMRELAAMVIRVAGNKVGLTTKISDDKDYLTDNPNRRCPNIQKAKRLLNFNPSIGLEEGLQKTYQYYLDNPLDIDA